MDMRSWRTTLVRHIEGVNAFKIFNLVIIIIKEESTWCQI